MPCIKCCSTGNFLNFLKGADKVCDYVPIISSVSNAVDLIGKGVFAINKHCCHGNLSQHNRYFRHLDDKSALRCVAGAIPFIGNAGLAIYDVCKLCCKEEEYLSSSDSSESVEDESSQADQAKNKNSSNHLNLNRENKKEISDASSADDLHDVEEKQPSVEEENPPSAGKEENPPSAGKEEKQPSGGSDPLKRASAPKENTPPIDSASSKAKSSKKSKLIRGKKPSKSKKTRKPVLTADQQKSFVVAHQKIGEFFELSEVFSNLNKAKIQNININDENDLGELTESAILFNMMILNIIREINEISQLKGYSIYRDLSHLDVIVERDENQFMGCFKAFNGIYQTWLAGQEGIDCDDSLFKEHLQNFANCYQEWLEMTEQINDLKNQVRDDNHLLESIYEPPSNDLIESVIGGGMDALLSSLLRVEGEVDEIVNNKEEKKETPEPSGDESYQMDVSILFTNSVLGDEKLNQLKVRYLNISLTESQNNQKLNNLTMQANDALANFADFAGLGSQQNHIYYRKQPAADDDVEEFQDMVSNASNPYAGNSSIGTGSNFNLDSLPDIDLLDPSEKKEPSTAEKDAGKQPLESEKSETNVSIDLDFSENGEPFAVEEDTGKQPSESSKSKTNNSNDTDAELNFLNEVISDFVQLPKPEPKKKEEGASQPAGGFVRSFLGRFLG